MVIENSKYQISDKPQFNEEFRTFLFEFGNWDFPTFFDGLKYNHYDNKDGVGCR
jgi:hypothetical protein